MKLSPWVFVGVGFMFGMAAGLTYASRSMRQLAAADLAMSQGSTDRFAQLGALHKEAVEKWQACSARWNDAASTGTVIYEPELDHQPESMSGVLAWALGQRNANTPATTRTVRWIIPFKVEPQVADAVRGAKYGWIDKDGKFQGWFTPKQVE